MPTYEDSSFDYSAADASSAPLTAGDYDATIESAEPGESKAGGPKSVVKFRLAPSNRVITDHVAYSQAAAWKNDDLAAAARVARPTEISAAGHQRFCTSLVGKHLRIRVKEEAYGDKTTVKVDRYLKGEPAQVTPMVPRRRAAAAG